MARNKSSAATPRLSRWPNTCAQLRPAGTKIVCAEGDCGACTVLVGRPTAKCGICPSIACIQFVFQLDGTHVVTVEGLPENGDMHPVQQAMVDCHGSQCGYCTPGFVMALAGWAEQRRAQRRSADIAHRQFVPLHRLCADPGGGERVFCGSQLTPVGDRFDNIDRVLRR